MTRRRVDVVVGFGGYASAPAYLAARARSIPIAVHEANAGPASRTGSARASPLRRRDVPVHAAAPRTLVGLPLRREIEPLDRRGARGGAAASSASTRDARRSWSRAARPARARINETASPPRRGDPRSRLAGPAHHRARSAVDDPGLAGYHLLEYCDRMDLALAAADLAVSRAGSATVSELAALGLPAVFVPYPVGNGEQALNARGRRRRRRRGPRRRRRLHPDGSHRPSSRCSPTARASPTWQRASPRRSARRRGPDGRPRPAARDAAAPPRRGGSVIW